MVDARQEQKALEDSLAACEECLETPVVPGEAVEWVGNLRQALDDLEPKFTVRRQKTHRDQLEEITAQDDELFTRVDNLREEDEAIGRELATLQSRVAQLAGGIQRAEPDEVKAEPAFERIVAQGLELIIRIRKQELAIGTWLVEAFQRDRGVGD